MNKLLFFSIEVFVGLHSTLSQACEEHWIRDVSDRGHLIKLENGSLWRIDSPDSNTSSLWLQFAEVAVCGEMMINEDTREELHAERIQ